MFINIPEKFAEWFNMKHPGAPRQISVVDVENLKSCGLIHHYGFYSTSQDGKTVMGILKYEQMRERSSTREPTGNIVEAPQCRMCGQPLPPEPENKTGRPKEYCPSCEPSRTTERYRRWWKRQNRLQGRKQL